MKKCVLRIVLFSLFFCICFNFKFLCVVSNASVRIMDKETAQYRSYTIYNQSKYSNNYIKNHGCGTCCLTTILHAYGKRKELGPTKVHSVLEKNTFGKSFTDSKPLGMRGMRQILKNNNIEVKYYVNKYSTKKIKSILEQHLSKGKPAVVLLKQEDGHHYILLLKYDSTEGKVVVGDSSGKTTRTYYASLNNIVKNMVKGKSGNLRSYPYYFNKNKTNGGMLLITE